MLDIICINYEGMDQEELHLSVFCQPSEIVLLCQISIKTKNRFSCVKEELIESSIDSDTEHCHADILKILGYHTMSNNF